MFSCFHSSGVRTFVVAIAACLSAQSAFSQGSPWIGEPETGTVTFTFVNQNATEYWRPVDGKPVKGPGALGATDSNLAQRTMWVSYNYAVNDFMAVDVQTGYAASFVKGAVGPSGGEQGYDGLFDSNISVTFRLLDELVSNGPSVAVRVGGILAGGYDTGFINSLGDGANGLETSVIIGKFGRVAGFSAELGYRYRGSTQVNPSAIGPTTSGVPIDVPNELFTNLAVLVPAGDKVTFGVDYRIVNALSGLYLGGPGFSPSRFPALEEDIQVLSGRAIVQATDSFGFNFFAGQVVRGVNTAASTLIGGGVSFRFGGGAAGF